ncbi:hypothetical protein Val02_52050 [Virgisporangium aliadipatigenens]|uniref:CHAT domain-containing protein n=1 Tax=Virgisporangium aliadipatigenens TaxID=741659 RepID=A0A8J3YMM6_9ACTN|nr:CHAT domain-containing protein [Virgisporangium aliadipatigenens]GIJ48319.1 hypothetical protein Val02_52050 [Virgisporangium aliadipatigenens]
MEGWWRQQAVALRAHLVELVGAERATEVDRRIVEALALPDEALEPLLRRLLRQYPAIWAWLAKRRDAGPVYRGDEGDSALPSTASYHLVADLPERHPVGRALPVQVAILRDPDGYRSAALPLTVPPEGVTVTLMLSAPTLSVASDLVQHVRVLPGADSPWAYFEVWATVPEQHRLRLRAYVGGTFLAELSVQLTATAGGLSTGHRYSTPIGLATHPDGAVTLEVVQELNSYRFVLTGGGDIVEALGPDRTTGRVELPHVLAELDHAVNGAYGGDAHLVRNHVRNTGAWLWSEVMPAAIRERFWHLLPRMRSFVVATGLDTVPWELMLPSDEHRSGADFLADLVPVVRRAPAQGAVRGLPLGERQYLAQDDAPAGARAEIEAVRRIFGDDPAAPALSSLRELVEVLESRRFGLLHLACHAGSRDGWASIALPDGELAPLLLSHAAATRAFRERAPLVFLNACRSAPSSPENAAIAGWARVFMAAGAGAFVGSMWTVRSDLAAVFADAFYRAFTTSNVTLGQATQRARAEIRGHGYDPTWLSYAVWGEPNATFSGAARAGRQAF